MKRVFVLTVPEAFSSGVLGPLDLLRAEDAFLDLITGEPERPAQHFQVELVGPSDSVPMTFGRNLAVDRLLDDARGADVVYVPPLALMPDRTPSFDDAVLAWLGDRKREGAQVCAACTGTLLMAAAGLLDGECATTHWAYEDIFRRSYPKVDLKVARTLVVTGEDQCLVTAGAHASWHDLMLYVIHRYAGAAAARKVAKVFLLDWHDLDQSAYASFREPLQHGDEAVLIAQRWLAEHLHHDRAVETAAAASGLPERSFLRRFRQATGHTPLRYLQHLRIERAKSLLESSDQSVEAVAWRVGYEDVPYFRRLFRKTTGINPAQYRKSFRTPPDVQALLEGTAGF